MNGRMIETIRITKGSLEATEEALREAGRHGHERFVLWTGAAASGMFRVATTHVPDQVSYSTDHGCGVRVEADALHRLNVWLYEHGAELGVQVHSHPTDAYHSDTDDAYPIVTTEGGVSIVVADFCAQEIIAPTTVAYRLERGVWRRRPIRFEVE